MSVSCQKKHGCLWPCSFCFRYGTNLLCSMPFALSALKEVAGDHSLSEVDDTEEELDLEYKTRF